MMMMGNLGGAPETRRLNAEQKVTSFSVALNKYWVDEKTGEEKETTSWVKVECWGKASDYAENLSKGDTVFVRGELVIKEVEKDGDKKWFTSVKAVVVRKVVSMKDIQQETETY